MNVPQAPYSQLVRLNQIGLGVERRLEPDAGQRARIAAALDLQALDRFVADVDLKPTETGWRLSGRIVAHAVQTCGISLEPLPEDIDARFSITLAEATDSADAEVEVTLDDDAPDLVEGGAIDLGIYAVEQLALALDPFPRKPGAEFEPPPAEAEISPFAALRGLGEKGGDGKS